VEFAYNNKAYSSIKTLPFRVNHGQDLRMEFKTRRGSMKEQRDL